MHNFKQLVILLFISVINISLAVAGTLDGASSADANSVAIGPGAEAGGSNSVAIGDNSFTFSPFAVSVGGGASANSLQSSVVGASASVEGQQATAMGSLAQILGQASSAFGGAAEVEGTNASAFGANSFVGANNASAFGASTIVEGDGSTALGFQAEAAAANSVALGSNSLANEANTVSVGNSDTGVTRRITNVAAATANNDAVNLFQFNAGLAGVRNDFSTELNNVRGELNRGLSGVRQAAFAGIAAAAAFNPVTPSAVGKTAVSIGAATYRGEQALSLSFSRLLTGAPYNASVNGGLSYDSSNHTLGKVGVAWEF